MDSLFSRDITPLASLLRPEKLDDLVGQSHLIGKGKPIRKFIEAGRLPSILLWWPPGCGKTSLARVISNSLDGEFFHLSAVLAKKEDVVKIIGKAQKNFAEGRQTILFLDEIHRWSKSQQDVLLPWVEKGIITLIGATTENPSFTVINALLSRCRTYILEPIKPEEVVNFIIKNLSKISERYPDIILEDPPEMDEIRKNSMIGTSKEKLGNPPERGDARGVISERWGTEGKWYFEYNRGLTEYAKENRKEMNEPEKIFWYQILHQDIFKTFHFRKQKPLGIYIVDFYSARLALVIEIDGESHIDQIEYDRQRSEYFGTLGLREIRFTNREVSENTEWVYEKLKSFIEENPPLSPLSGESALQKQTDTLHLIAQLGWWDLRNTLNLLETACILQWAGELTRESILEAGSKSLMYDQDGEEHYNLISAMHKSLRDSDGDAAIYWIGRMLAGGEDPRYIARRMMNFASEDVSDPQAMILANATYDICEKMGMPECELPMMNTAYYLADLPKDNRIYIAMKAMHQDIEKYGNLAVPLHLRNAPTALMKSAGYGAGYEYAHNLEEKKSSQKHFPEELQGRKYRSTH